MALPAVDAIIAAHPSATIDVFVGVHSRVAFDFRRQLTTRPVPNSLNLSSAIQLSSALREGRYEMVVCLDRSRWLRLAARLSRAAVTGHARSLSPEPRHESDVYLDVVRELGIPTPYSTPSVIPSSSARQQAADLLSGYNPPIVVLHPGGAQNPGTTMLDKRWPAERFGELARTLHREGATVLLSGGAGDRDVAASVASRADLDASSVLAGRVDIETLTGILDRSAAFVGPDTGVTHIAAAVGASTIAIFGPTNPRRYRPLGRHVQVLAPPESWQIPDRDLRRTAQRTSSISTDEVSLATVLAATRDAINREHGSKQCET